MVWFQSNQDQNDNNLGLFQVQYFDAYLKKDPNGHQNRISFLKFHVLKFGYHIVIDTGQFG